MPVTVLSIGDPPTEPAVLPGYALPLAVLPGSALPLAVLPGSALPLAELFTDD